MQKNSLNQSLLSVQYPQKSPQKFLDEYQIASGNKASIIQANYRECVANEAKITPCFIANNQSSQVKKKLRRGF